MSTNIANIVAPPLDLDLNSIDTSMPLLAAGIYDMVVAKVEQKSTKLGAPMLAIDLTTTGPGVSQDGNQLGAGVHVFTNINMQPTGKSTWEIVLKNIAAVTQGLGVATTYGELTANPQMLQGKTARVKLSVAPSGTDKNGKTFRAKNEIEVWMKA